MSSILGRAIFSILTRTVLSEENARNSVQTMHRFINNINTTILVRNALIIGSLIASFVFFPLSYFYISTQSAFIYGFVITTISITSKILDIFLAKVCNITNRAFANIPSMHLEGGIYAYNNILLKEYSYIPMPNPIYPGQSDDQSGRRQYVVQIIENIKTLLEA
jgi:hypothetical protein